MIAQTATALIDSDNQNVKAERLLEALAEAPPGAIVEIGCLRTPTEWRYDGWSTVHLARAARAGDRVFQSFDTDQLAVDVANRVLEEQGLSRLVQCLDGVRGIEEAGPLAFLYLDGSNDPQEALTQLLAATFVPGAILAIDDVQQLDWDKPFGKASLIVPMLRAHGVKYKVTKTVPGWSMLVARIN